MRNRTRTVAGILGKNRRTAGMRRSWWRFETIEELGSGIIGCHPGLAYVVGGNSAGGADNRGRCGRLRAQ